MLLNLHTYFSGGRSGGLVSQVFKNFPQFAVIHTEEWIKKIRYIYTMEYDSATRKNKIMPSAETWTPWTKSHQASLAFTIPEFAQTHVH